MHQQLRAQLSRCGAYSLQASYDESNEKSRLLRHVSGGEVARIDYSAIQEISDLADARRRYLQAAETELASEISKDFGMFAAHAGEIRALTRKYINNYPSCSRSVDSLRAGEHVRVY